jgi:hypothetical protein
MPSRRFAAHGSPHAPGYTAGRTAAVRSTPTKNTIAQNKHLKQWFIILFWLDHILLMNSWQYRFRE